MALYYELQVFKDVYTPLLPSLARVCNSCLSRRLKSISAKSRVLSPKSKAYTAAAQIFREVQRITGNQQPDNMKTLFLTFVALIIGLTTFAQTPTTFNYQAVLRDASGGILANQQVEIGVAILQGSASGTEVFTETHSVNTNNFGLANLQIGSINTAGMETVDWSAGSYFIQISPRWREFVTRALAVG